MIDLRHLRTLHALRETDSLPEAAERLHLTQSALSHQFRELETRVGMPVFVCKSKPVRFTTAGLKLLQLADLYGCPTDELLLAISPRPQDQDMQITSIIKALGEADKQFALEFLQTLATHLAQRK